MPILITSGLGLLALLLLVIPNDDWSTLLVYLLSLYVLGLVLYRRGILAVDPRFPAALLALCLLAKLLGSTARYWTVVDLYDRSADAIGYHRQGELLADYLRAFDFSFLGTYRYKGSGTTWMAYLTGLIYTLFPPNLPGVFLFFAGLSFAGAVFSYMTHRLLLPTSSPFWYMVLVFFSPSMLFWPSSLGKESWMIFCTGLVSWGWMHYTLRGRMGSLLLVGVGLALIAPIRPHIAAFLALALVASFLLRAMGGKQSPVALVAGGILVMLVAGVLLQFGAQFLGLSELSPEALQEEYQDLQSRELSGGSSFTPPSVLNPVGAVYGIITILFRPFPFEAHNAQALVTSLESLGWLALLWLRRRVLWERLRALPSTPFLGFALVYTLVMALGLTVSGNFGIVARQRVMFLPLFWMLFA